MTTGIRPISAGIGEIPLDNATSLANRPNATPMGTSRLPRPLQTHKPLPSPPVAQVVNPYSPLKAQRTLIDAYSGSRMRGNWPIIHPENVATHPSSHRRSLPLPSNIDSIHQSSFDGASDDRSIRLRRLSWHSANSDVDDNASAGVDIGPVLRISADADAVILGTGDSIPEVPSIPTVVPGRLAQSRSLGALRSRITQATESKTSLSFTPPTPTPNPMRSFRNLTPVVKISPIRSMRPARKNSFDGHSPKTPSPLARPFVNTTAADQPSAAVSSTKNDAKKGVDKPAELMTPVSKPSLVVSHASEAPDVLQKIVDVDEKSAEAHPGSTTASQDEQDLNIKKIRKTVTTVVSSTSSLDLKGRSSNDDKSWKANPFDQGLLSLSRTMRPYDTASHTDPHKFRVTETAMSQATDNSSDQETLEERQSGQSERQLITKPVAPSHQGETPSDKQDRPMTDKKVKSQRSIRDLFSRGRSRTKPEEPLPKRQGFMSATRSSLVNAMRDSKSRSRVHLPWPTESKSQTEISRNKSKKREPIMPLTAFKFAGTSASPPRQLVPDNREKTRAVVLDILDRSDEQPRDSKQRLRDTQIAECVISAAESVKNAEMCALEAKKNSRDAEIHADRAGIELMRLYGLLGDAGLDDETVQAFRRLVRKLTTGGKPEGF